MNIVYPWHILSHDERERIRIKMRLSNAIMRHYLSGRRRPRHDRAMAMARLTRGRLTAGQILGVE